MGNSLVFSLLLMVVVRAESYFQNNNYLEKGERKITRRQNKLISNCDLYSGRWVNDSSYPLYDALNCPFIENQFNCQRNGRPDHNYLHFRWDPSPCFLPRFDGIDFLRRLRGKRIMFVGDSISLNQWQSLACMLHTATPNSNYTLTRTGGLSEFTFPKYNISLMLLRDGFLIKIVNERIGRVLELNSVSEGQSWKGIDILIFNTWHWWLHTGRKQPWDFIEDGNTILKDMDRLVAYEKGLRTWASWVDSQLNSTETKVFFQGISPDHMEVIDGADPKAKSCTRETQPLRGRTYPGGQHPAERIVEKVVGEMRKPVSLLRVTTLSQLRKDAHPGVYGLGRHRLPDCSHWCLPGVPDTWNQLLYASIFD